MLDNTVLTDDWTKNWQVSIAVKITSVVMWALIIVVFLVAVMLLKDLEQRIREGYESRADLLAYQVAEKLRSETVENKGELRSVIGSRLQQLGFTGVELVSDSGIEYLGNIDSESVLQERELKKLGSDAGQVLRLYHPDPEREANRQRNEIVVAVLTVLLLFGGFLVVAIRTILHKPLQVLVNATREISQGNHSVRVDMKRDDEFGALSRFFNEMMDKLIEQQDVLRNALEQANSASRSKSAFLANMSHELRTPLNAIIGYSEMLEEDAVAEQRDDVVADLRKIQNAGRHLLSLINGVLDLSKIEAGKTELDLTRFDVTGLVNEVAETILPMVQKNGNRLSVYTDETIGLIQADEIKLRQALINLLSNAAKFTDQGMVSITVQRYRSRAIDWVRFVVKDNGIGMSEQQQSQLFKEFSQGDSSTTRKYGGTGLGLAISRRFCQLMGGDIGVKSQEGVGSEFTLRIPVKLIGENEVPPIAEAASEV